MSQVFCINESGTTVQLYEHDWVESGKTNAKKGKIYPNECFTFASTENGAVVTYLSSTGSVVSHYIPLSQLLTIPQSFTTCWEKYGFNKHTVDGTTYKTFKLRRSEELYNSSGNKITTLSAGTKVISDCESGDSHTDWIKIKWLEDANGNRKDLKFDGNTYSYAYLDSGLNISSSKSVISVYGNW